MTAVTAVTAVMGLHGGSNYPILILMLKLTWKHVTAVAQNRMHPSTSAPWLRHACRQTASRLGLLPGSCWGAACCHPSSGMETPMLQQTTWARCDMLSGVVQMCCTDWTSLWCGADVVH